MTELHLWLRHETRTTERRTPIVPVRRPAARRERRDAHRRGVTAAGLPDRGVRGGRLPCRRGRVLGLGTARTRSIVGLKELPDEPAAVDAPSRLLRARVQAAARRGGAAAPVRRRGRGAARPRVPGGRRRAQARRLRLLGRISRRGPRRAAPPGQADAPRCGRRPRRSWTRNSPAPGGAEFDRAGDRRARPQRPRCAGRAGRRPGSTPPAGTSPRPATWTDRPCWTTS